MIPLFRLGLSAIALGAVLLQPGVSTAQETKGTSLEASPANLALTLEKAQVVLPARAAGQEIWRGHRADLPGKITGQWPVAVVMHGSSGIAAFITEYQLWLARELGVASVAPDSMAIPDRLTYKSPVSVEIYERVHALRAAELAHALDALRKLPWADQKHILLIGTSEGSVPVARSADPQVAARIVYAWSCEKNYFVAEPRTAMPPTVPVLNAIAGSDPYFSGENPWNRDYAVTGSCAAAMRGFSQAAVYMPVLKKHTIINEPDVRDVTAAFIRRVLMQ